MMIMILMYVFYLHTCILLYVANQNFQISMRTSEYLRFAASKCAISRQIIKTFMNQRMSFSCFLKKVYNSNNCCSLCLSIISDMSWCVPLLLLTNGTMQKCWNCRPQDTPFEDGTFKLTMEFTEDYPNKPPSVRFVSTMFHPNGLSSVSFLFAFFDYVQQ